MINYKNKNLHYLIFLSIFSVVIFSYFINNEKQIDIGQIKGFTQSEDFYQAFNDINKKKPVSYDYDNNIITIELDLQNDELLFPSEIESLVDLGWEFFKSEKCLQKNIAKAYPAMKETKIKACVYRENNKRVLIIKTI